MRSTAVQMQGVNKWFGDFQVLKNIDLSVETGERVVVCGPSGSGKSTVVRCINRLEAHQEGVIRVNGAEVTDRPEDLGGDVGMVFQQFNLFPHLTVLQNLTLGAMKARGLTRAQAEERAMEIEGYESDALVRSGAPRRSEVRESDLRCGLAPWGAVCALRSRSDAF